MAMETILIVEDDEDIRELIHFNLFKQKYNVLEAKNGKEAIELSKQNLPQLILLDIMIPVFDGLEVCRELKKHDKTKDIKIIFISAKGDETDIITGLELGADDYITKPFSPKIMLARINTVLSRDRKKVDKLIEINGITIDENKRLCLLKGEEINLSQTEFQLLKVFAENPGRVFTRNQMVTQIKGSNHAVTDRAIDTQVVSLRKKLGAKEDFIETVWGVGYRFKENEN